MKQKVHSKVKWIALTIALLACLFSHLLLSNWTLHARFNLLLHGYLFVELKPPGQYEGLSTERVPSFVSRWVFKENECLGYLDRYGNFISESRSENWDGLDARTIVATAILFYSRIGLLFISLFISLALLVQEFRRRAAPHV